MHGGTAEYRAFVREVCHCHWPKGPKGTQGGARLSSRMSVVTPNDSYRVVPLHGPRVLHSCWL
jgi:hypothetical protein